MSPTFPFSVFPTPFQLLSPKCKASRTSPVLWSLSPEPEPRITSTHWGSIHVFPRGILHCPYSNYNTLYFSILNNFSSGWVVSPSFPNRFRCNHIKLHWLKCVFLCPPLPPWGPYHLLLNPLPLASLPHPGTPHNLVSLRCPSDLLGTLIQLCGLKPFSGHLQMSHGVTYKAPLWHCSCWVHMQRERDRQTDIVWLGNGSIQVPKSQQPLSESPPRRNTWTETDIIQKHILLLAGTLAKTLLWK